MIRRTNPARDGWRETVEAEGLVWHTLGDRRYWSETTHYSFTLTQIETIEKASAEIWRMLIVAGRKVVDNPLLMDRFGIPEAYRNLVRDTWHDQPPSLAHMRLDLGWDGTGAPKLFEVNADTPTAMLEAAVCQWSWKEALFPDADQYNSLHDKLVARWAAMRTQLPGKIHFAYAPDASGEDAVTCAYLADTAERAGLATAQIALRDIGWNNRRDRFVDLDGEDVDAFWKLCPWEWLASDAYSANLLASVGSTVWMEPAWKMVWSNKAILAVMWDLFPGHPNLLRASLDPIDAPDVAVKPLLAREGANVRLVRDGETVAETDGPYDGPCVWQDLYRLPETADGVHPVLGAWVVDGEPAGMGIREDGLVTGNTASFVPHIIEG